MEDFSIASLRFIYHYFPPHPFISLEILCLLSFEAISALVQALHPRVYTPYSQPWQTPFLCHCSMPNSSSSMMAHQKLTNSVDNSIFFLSNIILMPLRHTPFFYTIS